MAQHPFSVFYFFFHFPSLFTISLLLVFEVQLLGIDSSSITRTLGMTLWLKGELNWRS